jgi:hypothetical protein
VDALIEMLTATLRSEISPRQTETAKSKWHRLIIDAVTQRVLADLPDVHPPDDFR